MAASILVLLYIPAQAAVLKVGNDGQHKTVQEAVNAARDFDTILIGPGVYRSGKAITVSGRKGLTIEGAGPGKVQLLVTDPYASVIEIYRSQGVRIANISARHEPSTANVNCAGAVIDVQHAADTTIIDCELNGCGAAGVDAIDSTNVSIVRNNIHHNSFAGLWLIRVTGTVQDNRIADNARALYIVDEAGLIFKNNTFANNGPRGGPLAAADFALLGVGLGDSLATVTAKLGNPAKVDRTQDGFSYDFGRLEVITDNRNEVVNLLTDDSRVATRRGIRPGSVSREIMAAHGGDYQMSEHDGLDLYEYSYQTGGRGEYVLRFAVDRATDKIRYIGCRARSALEAPLEAR